MKERPILFSGDMVRAILEGRKTQTRRVIKPQPVPCEDGSFDWRGDNYEILPRRLCPYGREGDRLWVRETWAILNDLPDSRDAVYRADYPEENAPDGKWTPSIFMPRWASRITLDVTSITVERVQDISEEDAIAEGVTNDMDIVWQSGDDTPIGLFGELWDSINAKRGYSWDSNPWVWVVEFRIVTNDPT